MKAYTFNLLEQNLFLHPLKAVYWENRKILLIADVHLGKAAHFRKSGIPVSDEVHKDDLSRINTLLQLYKPDRFIILGDLFHSSYNKSWEIVRAFFDEIVGPVPELVLGNHDIMEPSQYGFLQVHTSPLSIPPFLISHEPVLADQPCDYYNLCGHIHPGVTLKGRARQTVSAPCFYFDKKTGILPAFGKFTGLAKTSGMTSRAAQIFAISTDSVIPLQ